MKRVLLLMLAVMNLVMPCRAETADEGEWIPAEDAAITEEILGMVDAALNGIVGVSYMPMALLGIRETAGAMDYAILCQARVVVPGAAARWVVFYIRAWGPENVETLKIADFDPGCLLGDEN